MPDDFPAAADPQTQAIFAGQAHQPRKIALPELLHDIGISDLELVDPLRGRTLSGQARHPQDFMRQACSLDYKVRARAGQPHPTCRRGLSIGGMPG